MSLEVQRHLIDLAEGILKTYLNIFLFKKNIFYRNNLKIKIKF
jgi:hypothetical protein